MIVMSLIENINKEIESHFLKKNQMEILELESKITEKNSLEA